MILLKRLVTIIFVCAMTTVFVTNDAVTMHNKNKVSKQTKNNKKKQSKFNIELHNYRTYVTFTLGKKPNEKAYEVDVTPWFHPNDSDSDISIICLNGERKGRSPTNVMLNNALNWIKKNTEAIKIARQKLLSKDKPIAREYEQFLKTNPENFKHGITQGSVGCDVNYVVADNKSMPVLCAMIENLAKKLNLPTTPIIWICDSPEAFLYNAGVIIQDSFYKLLIGKNFIVELTTSELEAQLAHEMSHIYYNHPNSITNHKYFNHGMYFFNVLIWVGAVFVQPSLFNNVYLDIPIRWWINLALLGLIIGRTHLIETSISRYFEKQADLLALKIIDNPEELSKGLDHLNVLEHGLFRKEIMRLLELTEGFWQKLAKRHPGLEERKKYIEEYCQNNSK